MMDQEYEEDLLFRRLAKVKTLVEEGKVPDNDLIEQVCSLVEIILGDDWWEISGRISRSKAMFGTGYSVRYDLVKNSIDIQTVIGKGKKYLINIIYILSLYYRQIITAAYSTTVYLDQGDRSGDHPWYVPTLHLARKPGR